jgi:hypothetical protein
MNDRWRRLGGWSVFAALVLTVVSIGLLALRSLIGPPFSTEVLTHSPVEIVDALIPLALVPVALALERAGQPSRLARVGMVVGVAGLLAGAVLHVLFAASVMVFGQGRGVVVALQVSLLAVCMWLVLAGAAVRGGGQVPRSLAWLTVACGALLMIPFPIWSAFLAWHWLRPTASTSAASI